MGNFGLLTCDGSLEAESGRLDLMNDEANLEILMKVLHTSYECAILEFQPPHVGIVLLAEHDRTRNRTSSDDRVHNRGRCGTSLE